MVGDYFSRMATAQNMPPQALTKSVQNGVLTPNMASDTMQSQARPAPSQGIQSLQEPPIAQQVMQEADQLTAPEKLAQEIDYVRGNIQKVQEGVQAGSIEAYKGIPFLKEQINTLRSLEQQLQALTNPQQAMQQMPQMPAQQTSQMPPQQMAQAPQGIDAAQSNLPAEGYAGGGIVAFVNNENQPVDAEMPSTTSRFEQMLPSWLKPGNPQEYLKKNKAYKDLIETTKSAPGFFEQTTPQKLAESQANIKAAGEVLRGKPPEVVPVAPVAETKKKTGIIIHDNKPSSGGGIKREPPTPRTDLGIPLIYGPPEEDVIATQKAENKASNEELKKLILGDAKDRDKQSTIQTLLKIMGRGFEAAGGTSPYAMANIGPAAAKGAGDIAELYAQQEAAKEKRVGQLVALGLKGQELNAELAKLGLTKKYQEMHGPLFQAQAAEARAKIPLYAAQTDYFYRRPTAGAGANAGAPKGIPFAEMRKVEQEFEGYLANPKTILASPLERMIPPETDKTLGWIRQGLGTKPGTPSYNNSMKAVRDIAEAEKNKMYQKGYLLGGRNSAPGVFASEEP